MESLAGTTWKLVEVRAYDEAGRELESPIAEPMGLTMFGKERMLGAVTDVRSGDVPARVYFSYSGPYTWDGTTLSTAADQASRPDMLTHQVRDMRFETPTRLVVKPKTSLLGRASGLTFVWERLA